MEQCRGWLELLWVGGSSNEKMGFGKSYEIERRKAMKTITRKFQLYSFDDLDDAGKEQSINDQINFEIETMTEASQYFHCAVEMEEMQTPWFLGECIYEHHEDDIINSIRECGEVFLKSGGMAPKMLLNADK
jgi:hypothetical protein